jgi:hypothetical protein
LRQEGTIGIVGIPHLKNIIMGESTSGLGGWRILQWIVSMRIATRHWYIPQYEIVTLATIDLYIELIVDSLRDLSGVTISAVVRPTAVSHRITKYVE